MPDSQHLEIQSDIYVHGSGGFFAFIKGETSFHEEILFMFISAPDNPGFHHNLTSHRMQKLILSAQLPTMSHA